MKILRNGARRDSGATVIVDKAPVISWDNKSKEVVLSVKGIRDTSNNGSFYNYQIALTANELQGIVGSITK